MIIKRKSDLIPNEKSNVSFGAIFTGAGFPIIAAEWAGLEVKWGIESRDSFNIKTFRHNFRTVMYSTEIEAFFNIPVDIIWGSPSCGEFSSAGRNSSNDTKMLQKDFESFEYVKFISEVIKRRPKIFILENIPSVKKYVEFTSTPAGFVLRHMITGAEKPLYDYYIEEHYITPTEVNIPQNRKRIFTIGTLFPNNFMLMPPEKDYKNELSIKDIFLEIAELREHEKLLNDTFPKHSDEKIEKMSRIKQGEGLYGGINNKRLKVDEPSPVIMSSSTRYIHPYENRLLTVREAACLMGIPLDFKFYGSENKCLDQVGKGIVPHVGRYILEQAKKYLENTI